MPFSITETHSVPSESSTKRADLISRQSLRLADEREGAVVPPDQSLRRADPERAVATRGHRHHVCAGGKSFRRAEGREASDFSTAHAAAGRADPQRALFVLHERRNAHGAQPILQPELPKPHAIKPREAAARAHPQEPVARLQEGVHGVLRKPVFGPPRANHPIGRRRAPRRRPARLREGRLR